MENVTLRDVARVLEGERPDVPDAVLAGVRIDSRVAGRGDVFFAIRGDRFDGHDFVDEALANGALGAVVSDDSRTAADASLIVRVADTTLALQELASWYRSRFDVRVVGITGTNGKTTTKDMAAAVLSTELETMKTEGNLNNHIGVPLTLLELTSRHEAAVIEMGMNHPGEIRRLSEIARPDVGVITNVAEGHLESMETLEAVAEAKGELLESLPADGVAVLNADDARVMAQASRTKAGVRTFGFGSGADVRALDVEERGCGAERPGTVLFGLEGGGSIELPVPGRHNVANALAALAVGDALGIDRERAAEGLGSFEPSPMRMLVSTIGPWTVLNDAYNSNPGSLAAALDALKALAAGRPSVAVLGDMLELGEASGAAHAAAGRRAAQVGVNYLFLFGCEVERLRDGALDAGIPPERARLFEDKAALVRELVELPMRDAVILVKGSRGMRMEEVVELLVKEAPAS
ncbi:MAG: UDP-N-acetylmuramoyl-tripeptide--D-alanyl-D-alanine ligase [Candidatus Eisenbacteria bacterium]